jgi:hypothetical protein
VGNWRTVNMGGTVNADEVPALRARLTYADDAWDNFGPLSFAPDRPALCGLGDWVKSVVDVRGNLAERDYGVADVATVLAELAELAPSLRLKVHCGGDWESAECVATITVRDGGVAVGPAEVESVAPAGDDLMVGRLAGYLTGEYGRRPGHAG